MTKASTLVKQGSAALIGLSAAAVCQAGLIDFSSSDWASAHGQSSFTFNGVTLTSSPWGTKLSQGPDGIGIKHFLDHEPDEIDNHEVLTVDFGVFTTVESVTISNLYTDEFCLSWPDFSCDEYGQYRLDGGAWQNFYAQDGSGLVTLASGQAVQKIDFGFDLDWFETSGISEFSVLNIKTADVPEPATLALLTLGLAGIGVARRRSR